MPAYVWITALAAVAFVALVAFGRRWLHSLWYSWTAAAHVVALTEDEPEPAPEYGSMVLDAERGWDAGFLPAPTVDPEPWRPGETRDGITLMSQVPDWREQTAAELSPEALEPPCPHEYTPNISGTHEWCQMCDSVRPLPEVVLPAPGGWISGPCLDDPGPGVPPSSLTVAPGPVEDDWKAGQGFVHPVRGAHPAPETDEQPPPASLPVQPSRWLAEQLAILYTWSEWQQQKAAILA